MHSVREQVLLHGLPSDLCTRGWLARQYEDVRRHWRRPQGLLRAAHPGASPSFARRSTAADLNKNLPTPTLLQPALKATNDAKRALYHSNHAKKTKKSARAHAKGYEVPPPLLPHMILDSVIDYVKRMIQQEPWESLDSRLLCPSGETACPMCVSSLSLSLLTFLRRS